MTAAKYGKTYTVITQDGNTALILASRYAVCGTESIVVLLKAGADVNLQNNVCWCLCLLVSDTMCIDWLSVITQNGNTALILASRYAVCGTESIVVLLKAGAVVNLQNNVCWCCV